MSNAVVNERTGALTAQGQRLLEMARQPLSVPAIATALAVKPATVRVYLSNLRRAGYQLPRSDAGDVVAADGVMVIISVAPALAAELRQQAIMRGLRPCLPMVTVQALLATIHADNLYNAVLGDLPGPRGRAA